MLVSKAGWGRGGRLTPLASIDESEEAAANAALATEVETLPTWLFHCKG